MATFLDQNGLKFYTTQLMNEVNTNLDSRIITTIASTNTDTQIPSALSVYTAIQAALASVDNVSFEVVTGDISTVTSPSTSTIYLQRDTTDDTTYVMYVYVNSEWIDIGDTTVDLSGYWSKTELVAITNADIQAIFEELYGA